MLVLTRKLGEAIEIDGPATVRVLRVSGKTIRLGITADAATPIRREEVAKQGEEKKP